MRKPTKSYFINTKTGKIHIKGCCPHSKTLPYNVEFFNSVDEALAFGGSSVCMCKICQKQKEKIIKETTFSN